MYKCLDALVCRFDERMVGVFVYMLPKEIETPEMYV
jgi:hypothetical protein